jgi:thermostable 8-oxoguanine DNA glycosylase
LNRNNDHLKQIRKKSLQTFKTAIKKAKEMWMKEEISKLLLINVDPFMAWQASKKIQSGLSHHHIDSKGKYTKLKTMERSRIYPRNK